MHDIAARMSASLAGARLEAVERLEATESWSFRFSQERLLNVACPWRILAQGRIAFGWRDHAQTFGLPSPTDGPTECRRLLGSVPATSVAVAAESGDIELAFAGGAKLQVFNDSSGYEGWTYQGLDVEIIALGGGALWSAAPRDYAGS